MGNLSLFLIISILVSIFAFAFAVWLYRWVSAQPSSNQRVKEVGSYIRQGANTFLKKRIHCFIKVLCGSCASDFSVPSGSDLERGHGFT